MASTLMRRPLWDSQFDTSLKVVKGGVASLPRMKILGASHFIALQQPPGQASLQTWRTPASAGQLLGLAAASFFRSDCKWLLSVSVFPRVCAPGLSKSLQLRPVSLLIIPGYSGCAVESLGGREELLEALPVMGYWPCSSVEHILVN